jgi:hypothetical protein
MQAAAMSCMTRILMGAVFLGLASCATPPGPQVAGPRAADLSFLPPKPEKGRVFTFYNYQGSAIRRNNWTSNFDLSGVSWNDPRTVTAITPNHVVMAAHFMRPMSMPVIFHDRDGNIHTRTITSFLTLNEVGDIAVGRLNQPLPSGVKCYRFAEPGDVAPMKLALVTDQTMALSLHRIGFVGDRRVVLGYDPRIEKIYHRNLIVGDSGNPAFVLRGKELLLLTTFTTGGAGTGPFYGDPAVRQAVENAVARLR